MIQINLDTKKLYFSGEKRGNWESNYKTTKLPEFTADIYSTYLKTQNTCKSRGDILMVLAYTPEIPVMPEGIALESYDSHFSIENKSGALILFKKNWNDDYHFPVYYTARELIRKVWKIVSDDEENIVEPDFDKIDKSCFQEIPGIICIPDIEDNCPDIYLLDKAKVEEQFFGKEPEFDYDAKNWSKKWDAWHKQVEKIRKEAPEKLLQLLKFKTPEPKIKIIDDIYLSQHRHLGNEKRTDKIPEPIPEIPDILTDYCPLTTDDYILTEQLTLNL